MTDGKIPELSAASRRRILVGVSLMVILAISVAYMLSDDRRGTLYASFLFLDGSREWAPLDVRMAVETIEAFQRMENKGLQNMIMEVDKDPYSSPTDKELERLWELYESSFESAKKNGWLEYANAGRDGFYDDVDDPFHYPNGEYLRDDKELDPGRPEFLMYYQNPEKPDERILAGFMYEQSAFDAHGDQIGGGLARWHKHIYGAPVCFDQNMVPHGMHEPGMCSGVQSSQSPEMLHVWFVDHPVSQFDSGMSLESSVIRPPVMMSKDAFMRKHRSLLEQTRE